MNEPTNRGSGVSIDIQSELRVRKIAHERPLVEDVLTCVLHEIRRFQAQPGGEFRCRKSDLAAVKIEEAVHWLRSLAAEREGAHSA